MKRARHRAPIVGLPTTTRRILAATLAAAVSASGPAAAQHSETPQTRLRPIGSPSAVDAFRGQPSPTSSPQPTSASRQPAAARSSPVRQAVMLQSADGSFAMPPGGYGSPPSSSPPATALPLPLSSAPLGPVAPPSAAFDSSPLPRSAAPPAGLSPQPAPPTFSSPSPRQGPSDLTPVPRFAAPTTAGAANSDYAPLAQPQLENQFATLSNCRNVSAPSGYRSDRILTCGVPAGYVTTVGASAPPPSYLPPPAQLGPPVILGPSSAPPGALPFGTGQAVIPGPAGYRPLISFGQERYPVQVGQGIFGQPTAYVPGQTFRNAIRYLTW